MKKREIEARIHRAVADLTPNVYDRIASAQPMKKEQEDHIMEFKTKKTKRASTVRRLTTAIAACLVLTLTLGGFAAYRSLMPDATIMLDVNPSISMEINRADKVLSVYGVNSDGASVLDGMNLMRLDYNTAVNAIIGAMLKNGYLTDETATVLVSVDSRNQEKAARIKTEVTDDIKNAVAASTTGGAQVFQQTLAKEDSGIQDIAAQHGISVGKAQLIRTVIERNAALTTEELAPLSVQDILAMAALNSVDLAGAVEYDNGDYAPLDESSLITYEEAKGIATVTVGGGDVVECELDYERGVWQYELEVIFDGYEYDIDINAQDGTVRRNTKERTSRTASASGQTGSGTTGEMGSGTGSGTSTGATITSEEAVAFALAAAGSGEVVGSELDDGKYEIKIRVGVDEYEYHVDRLTGEAVLHDVDYGEYAGSSGSSGSSGGSTAGTGTKVSLEEAKAIALSKAGGGKVVASELDDGVYEIDIRIGDDKFEYKVNASTGSVRQSDADYGEYAAGRRDDDDDDDDRYDDDDDDDDDDHDDDDDDDD